MANLQNQMFPKSKETHQWIKNEPAISPHILNINLQIIKEKHQKKIVVQVQPKAKQTAPSTNKSNVINTAGSTNKYTMNRIYPISSRVPN